METVHAPALNAENLPWFNVHKPLDLPDLKGKVDMPKRTHLLSVTALG